MPVVPTAAPAAAVHTTAVHTTTTLNRPCTCVNGGGIAKKWYRTEAEADDAAKIANDQYPNQPPQLPYRCEEGGVWHLTSKPAGTVVNTPGSLCVNKRLHAEQNSPRRQASRSVSGGPIPSH